MDVSQRIAEIERGYVFEPTGLRVVSPEDITKSKWRDIGYSLSARHSSTQWALGDWMLLHRGEWGSMYDDAMAITHLSYDQCARLHRTAQTFTKHRREHKLSWSHYALVSEYNVSFDQRLIWLDKAVANNFTVENLRRFISEEREKAGVKKVVAKTTPPAAERTQSPILRSTAPLRSRTHVQCPACQHVFDIASHRYKPPIGLAGVEPEKRREIARQGGWAKAGNK